MPKIAASFTLLIFFLQAIPLQARTVTDLFGRTVEVPDRIERLAALGTSLSFVTYLGKAHLAVGVETQEQLPMDKPYMLANWELARKLPSISKGGAGRSDDYEKIISLKPQVVFILSVRPDELALLERKLKIPVVGVRHGLFDYSEEEFLQSIRLVGEILEKSEEAESLCRWIVSLHSQLAYRPAVPAQAYVGGLAFRGAQDINSTTTRSTPMLMAGLHNMASGLKPDGHIFVNKEFLLVTNPPFMFIDSSGITPIKEMIKRNPGFFERLSAFRQGRVFQVMPHTAYFNNPEIIYANAFFMAKAAYPEKYPDLDPAAKADEIFRRFLGQPLYQRYHEAGSGYQRLTLAGDRLEAEPYEERPPQ
jgi:iron complex transport system substrate-binding protein